MAFHLLVLSTNFWLKTTLTKRKNQKYVNHLPYKSQSPGNYNHKIYNLGKPSNFISEKYNPIQDRCLFLWKQDCLEGNVTSVPAFVIILMTPKSLVSQVHRGKSQSLMVHSLCLVHNNPRITGRTLIIAEINVHKIISNSDSEHEK